LYLACHPPEIRLIPESSSLLSPIQFRRSQDFYILSMIKLNCNNSLRTTSKWIIINCTINCSKEISRDEIKTNYRELYIPSNILPYGIYQLILTVTMTLHPTLTTKKSVFIQISPSGITANLVPLGTSMITTGYQQNLLLDPGNYSIDPDGYPFNATVSKIEFEFF